MKRTIIKTVLLLGFLLPALVFGQVYLANETLTTSDRAMLESGLKFNSSPQDSFAFDYSRSPGKAFLLSAILPGAGEYYAGAKWRALAFAGVEVFSWIMYFNRKGEGKDIENKYIDYADMHWDLLNWLEYSGTNDRCGPEGSHSIWISYKVGDKEQEFQIDKDFPYDSLMLTAANEGGILTPIQTRDYYENIGKYDQFACGWDDYLVSHTTIDGNLVSDTVFVSPIRKKYLTQRKDSNDALKMATNFATAIMFNHIISAFHAQVAAKNYSPEAERVSWQVGLITDIRQKNPFRGVSLSVTF